MRKGLAAELLTLLKLDGSRAMTGDIDFGTDKVQRQILFPDVVLRAQAGSLSNILKVVDRAGALNRYIQTYGVFFRYFIGSDFNSYYRTREQNSAEVALQSYSAGAYTTDALLKDGMFSIPHAGDIVGLAGKGCQFDLFTANVGVDIGWSAAPYVMFASNDYIMYDKTNDRYLFYIASVVRGYLDAAGFHDGAPPP